MLFEKELDALGKKVFGQNQALIVLTVGLIAEENVALIGKPGEAKTLLAEEFSKAAFENSSAYYLLNNYTTPDEIFGMVSIKQLTENDVMVRNHKFYKNKMIILDEAFKANSATLNSLLGLLNEKKVEGVKYESEMIVALSNELPIAEEGAASVSALWDRFGLRHIVEPISSPELLSKVIKGEFSNAKISGFFGIPELRKKAAELRSNISKKVIDALLKLKALLEKEGINISTRRIAKAAKIVSAYAVLMESKQVEVSHLQILESVFWDCEDDIQKVNEALKVVIPDPLKPLKESEKILYKLLQNFESKSFDEQMKDLKQVKAIGETARIISEDIGTEEAKHFSGLIEQLSKAIFSKVAGVKL
jgi:MoxR-like ATPase